jgi:hypothetical protein
LAAGRICAVVHGTLSHLSFYRYIAIFSRYQQ